MGNISREEFDEEEALKVFQETIQNKTLNEEFQNLLKKTKRIEKKKSSTTSYNQSSF